MALILAIEPDRRQTTKIAALAKNPLRAELVSGESTESAVKALEGRVPDLVLTSMLLSPKDESALADWLRELDDAGKHVQTLVIPVLGNGRRSGAGGLLTRFKGKGTGDSTPDGCDPEVFAHQIGEYLERLAEERRAAAAFDDDDEAIEMDAARSKKAAGRTDEQELSLDEPWEEIKLQEEAEPDSVELTAEAIDLDKFVAELNTYHKGQEGREGPARQQGRDARTGQDRQEGRSSKAPADPPARPAPVTAPAPSKKPHDPVEEFAAALGAMVGAGEPARKNTKDAPRPKVQDEWGLFDPERCGFPALLAKLDKLSQQNRR